MLGRARARRAASRSSARSSRRSSATASTATRRRGYWLDIGTPERYLQGTFDILEGAVATAVGRAPGTRRTSSIGDGVGRRGRVVPPGARRAPARASATARTSAAASCSGAASRSARHARRARVVLAGRRDRRRLRAARLHRRPRRRAIGDARTSTGGAVLGEGVTIGADNVSRGRRADVPGRRTARRRDQVLTHDRQRLDRAAIEAVDVGGQLADVLALPEHLRDALWRVESAELEPHDAPGGLVVAGMGGSAIGGALAARRARRPGLAPDRRRRATTAAGVDDAGHDGAVRQLLGQHRGDARRATRRPGRSARAASSRRAAASSPARRARTTCR